MKSTVISRFIATGLGAGLSPIAPGTAGSMSALIMWWLCEWMSGGLSTVIRLACIGGVVVVGLLTTHAEILASGAKDPQHVVIDEWAGMWIALLGTSHGDFVGICGAFLLFRLFDITKPYPAARLESLAGSVGVMIDDVVAGLYGLIILCAATNYLL